MTVKELVAKLSLVSQDTVVEIFDEEGEGWCDVFSVDYVDKEQFDDPENDPYHRDHSVIRIA